MIAELLSIDREFMAPWGVTELAKLELLQPLREAGALFTRRNIPYDENFAPAEAEVRALDLTKMHSEGLGGLCLGHPATCDIFAQLATAAGAGMGTISHTNSQSLYVRISNASRRRHYGRARPSGRPRNAERPQGSRLTCPRTNPTGAT